MVEFVVAKLCLVSDTVPTTQATGMPPTLLGIMDPSADRALTILTHAVRLV